LSTPCAVARRADVGEDDVPDVAFDHLRARPAEHAVVVLGEVDRAAAADVGGHVLPLLLPGLHVLGRSGQLGLELLPELAENRLIGLRRRPEIHAPTILRPVSR
jgi:hypothetical protein